MVRFRDGWGATMTLSNAEFVGMCKAFGVPHVAEDPRFASIDARMKHRLELRAVMETEVADAAATMTVTEAATRMKAEEVPFARARRLAELHEDDQIRHNRIFREIEHPVAGRLRDARPAPLFAKTPAAPGGPAPTVGQHTREILTELGMNRDAIEALYERGVVS
jgi:crotonobetainyl-CoA:carnitine CoA-transferase CaiB-like acyl-CoA transferase